MSTPSTATPPITAPIFVFDLVNGIVGGLIATFLTLVIQRMWSSIILPWYEERVYQDAHFEGYWNAKETFTDLLPHPRGSRTPIQ
jgi:hypothetical protein